MIRDDGYNIVLDNIRHEGLYRIPPIFFHLETDDIDNLCNVANLVIRIT